MNVPFRFLLINLLFLIIGCSHDQRSPNNQSPYAGQETRDIKTLTPQEVEGYLGGMGMELSKVAELNHFPGPRHVLELADKLELTDQQREQTEELFNRMKEEAVRIGETYIEKERALNILFESAEVTPSTVDSLLIEIAEIKGILRSIHVKAHIKMKKILTSDQVMKYNQLRGYASSDNHSHT